jgi:hypothetical protein
MDRSHHSTCPQVLQCCIDCPLFKLVVEANTGTLVKQCPYGSQLPQQLVNWPFVLFIGLVLLRLAHVRLCQPLFEFRRYHRPVSRILQHIQKRKLGGNELRPIQSGPIRQVCLLSHVQQFIKRYCSCGWPSGQKIWTRRATLAAKVIVVFNGVGENLVIRKK